MVFKQPLRQTEGLVRSFARILSGEIAMPHFSPCAAEAHGRMAWQKSSGYNQRSLGETLMGRWKAVIGPKLKARSLGNQQTETKIGVRILNRMTELGHPKFERSA